MDEEQVRRVLAGDFRDLPSVSSRVVRIFTSSTFTGITLMHRNAIKQIYIYISDVLIHTTKVM